MQLSVHNAQDDEILSRFDAMSVGIFNGYIDDTKFLAGNDMGLLESNNQSGTDQEEGELNNSSDNDSDMTNGNR